MDWTIVETQADIDALDREVCGFHDSCIVGMEYKSGAFVNRDGSMTMTWQPEDYCLLLSLESQLSDGVVELLFSGLRRFHLAGLLRNRDCSIQSGYLAFHEGMIQSHEFSHTTTLGCTFYGHTISLHYGTIILLVGRP